MVLRAAACALQGWQLPLDVLLLCGHWLLLLLELLLLLLLLLELLLLSVLRYSESLGTNIL